MPPLTADPDDRLSAAAGAIRDIAERFQSQWQRHREHLHANPELTEHEFETTRWIARQCESMGLSPRVTSVDRGLVCDLDPTDSSSVDPPTRRVLVRGDIDALPIQTTSSATYRSTVADVMHACGHDVHTVCTLGAMQIIEKLRQCDDASVRRLASAASVRFCFQPAEENSTGGPLMVAEGATKDCAAAVALHSDPGRAVGTIGVRWGSFTASCDVFTATFSGRGGHGARPHLTDDCLSAAMDWTDQIYRRIPRSVDARTPVVVNVGTLHAGTAPNVIPATATISGTLRSTTNEGRDQSATLMRTIADAVAATHGCRCDLTFGVSNPPVINDDTVSDAIAESATLLLGPESVQTMTLPSMGAEDFAFIAAELPAAMFRLGIASAPSRDAADQTDRLGHNPLHTPDFDVDPQCLRTGASVLALSALLLSTSEPNPPGH